MKIALIGAGNWGIKLAQNLHQLGVLSHIVERNRRRLEDISKELRDVDFLTSFDGLLSSEIDAVAIATPVDFHYEIAAQFLKAGKDVFIEKPMTICSKEACDLVHNAEDNNAILMIGHMLLYQPAIKYIKEYLEKGYLGQIYHLHQERLKLGRVRSKENVIWSLGVHDIAVLLYLVGSAPDEISCSGHCGIQTEIQDDAYVHMTFKKGVKAHLHCSWLWPENRRILKIVGEKGVITYNEMEQTVVLDKKRIGNGLEAIDEGKEKLFEGSDQPLRHELEHFIHCIRSREEPLSNGRSGVEVLRVIESLNMS